MTPSTPLYRTLRTELTRRKAWRGQLYPHGHGSARGLATVDGAGNVHEAGRSARGVGMGFNLTRGLSGVYSAQGPTVLIRLADIPPEQRDKVVIYRDTRATDKTAIYVSFPYPVKHSRVN